MNATNGFAFIVVFEGMFMSASVLKNLGCAVIFVFSDARTIFMTKE